MVGLLSEKKITLIIGALSLLLMLGGCGISGGGSDSNPQGSGSAESVLTEAPEPARRAIDEHSWGNAYYTIQAVSTGKALVARNGAYDATGTGQAAVFYFKPSAPATYILYDQDSQYLKVNATGTKVVRDAKLEDEVQWVAARAAEGYTLKSLTSGKYLCADSQGGLILKPVADTDCRFVFEPARGNNPFPEAELNVDILDTDGKPLEPYQAMARPVPGQPIIGWCDAHIHVFANLGMGGTVIADEPFNPLGVTRALDDCTAEHGPHGILDLVGAVRNAETGYGFQLGHATDGWPTFIAWNTDSITHQQAYYKWLERAWLGGQRVMMELGVNSEAWVIVRSMLTPWETFGERNDTKIAEMQINANYAMQDYIDAQYGGPGQGWYRIVKNAAEARQVISQGKMAVFLGIEVQTIFDAKEDYITQREQGKITQAALDAKLADIRMQLDKFQALGVRSIFPLHALDNGFGGTKLYTAVIWNIANKLINGHFFEVEETPYVNTGWMSTNDQTYQYKETGIPLSPDAAIFLRSLGIDLPYVPAGGAVMDNARGLSKLGEWLIRELISRGMVIDLSHMSERTSSRALDLIWEARYPGVVASHFFGYDPRTIKIAQLGGIVSRHMNPWSGENQRTEPAVLYYLDSVRLMKELSRKKTPGFAVLKDEKYADYAAAAEDAYGAGWNKVPTTWYDTNDDPSDDLVIGQPLTTDANGICHLGRRPLEGHVPLSYENGGFEALNPGLYAGKVKTVRFKKQVTGQRVFDLNVDGPTHVGMLPDFLRHEQIQKDAPDYTPLFNSAEAYIRMIERVDRYLKDPNYPDRDPRHWIEVDTEFWHDPRFQ